MHKIKINNTLQLSRQKPDDNTCVFINFLYVVVKMISLNRTESRVAKIANLKLLLVCYDF